MYFEKLCDPLLKIKSTNIIILKTQKFNKKILNFLNICDDKIKNYWKICCFIFLVRWNNFFYSNNYPFISFIFSIAEMFSTAFCTISMNFNIFFLYSIFYQNIKNYRNHIKIKFFTFLLEIFFIKITQKFFSNFIATFSDTRSYKNFYRVIFVPYVSLKNTFLPSK